MQNRKKEKSKTSVIKESCGGYKEKEVRKKASIPLGWRKDK